MSLPLSQLHFCTDDIESLRSKLRERCARFGTIQQLDIVESFQSGRRQAICFLRMSTASEEWHLARELGVGRFGGELVAVIELGMAPAANDTLAPAANDTRPAALPA